jgi:hypothetical protein
MKAMILRVALILVVSAAGRPAIADEQADQERDCKDDALTWCGQYVFAPNRDQQIGYCLWEHRTQISSACRSHLRQPKRPPPR